MTTFVAQKSLPMDVIRIDGGTQSRLKIDTKVVDQYAEQMADGAEFPAAVAFFDGKEYWLADGFHRYHAFRKNKKAGMSCNIVNGTVRDAILYSFGANGKHGLPMSNEDKRNIVLHMLKDFEWGDWSDREIARKCGVSHVFVGKIRAEIGGEKKEKKFTHKNGTVTTMQPKADTPKAEPKVEPAAVAEMKAKVEQLEQQVSVLAEENDNLTDKLAVKESDDPDYTAKVIADLREENKLLKVEVKSLTVSRDQFQAENAQLIKQVNMLTKKLKKLESVA